MRRLSLPIEQIKPHYTVIVVGSGYGGAIAASRMARAGQQVCLLERGEEFQPGEYPNNLAEATREFQVDSPIGHDGSHTGLYDFRVNKRRQRRSSAAVSAAPRSSTPTSACAPNRASSTIPPGRKAIRTDSALLEQSYARAERMLNPKPLPESFPSLPKLNALQTSASALQGPFYRTPINVTFDEPEGGVNHVGVTQHKCNGCGDCVSGCNFHAKNTTLMNYLPDAVNHGAEIFTSVSVRYLERDGKGWIVHFQTLGDGRRAIRRAGHVRARRRRDSRRRHARLDRDPAPLGGPGPPALGETRRTVHRATATSSASATTRTRRSTASASAPTIRRGRAVVGPCITSVIDLRHQPALDDGMVIEEGSIPGGIAALMPLASGRARKSSTAASPGAPRKRSRRRNASWKA